MAPAASWDFSLPEWHQNPSAYKYTKHKYKYKYKYKHKYKIQIQKHGFIKTLIEGMTKDVASEAHAKRQKEIR